MPYKDPKIRKQRSNERSLRWRNANLSRDQANKLKYRYGITLNEYSALLEGQAGKCAICGTNIFDKLKKRRLAVDHDHKTGRVRGLLCYMCNIGLGSFLDEVPRLQAAIEYLNAHK